MAVILYCVRFIAEQYNIPLDTVMSHAFRLALAMKCSLPSGQDHRFGMYKRSQSRYMGRGVKQRFET